MNIEIAVLRRHHNDCLKLAGKLLEFAEEREKSAQEHRANAAEMKASAKRLCDVMDKLDPHWREYPSDDA
ncbi:hypothetical protein RSW49_22780 [Escherichia coli]|uniref:hypothetical protein n=1 Tax=Enterobacteriaceae TaxID=543 RepID=UPI001FF2DAAE|nr:MULTISPECIES: hypothetical protein [Enterobacteriaceae]MDT9046432.1 hypothetical protein [Escherichia coli]MDT9105776.1 hypothetical protein [Escherichia coli]UOV84354.1 hypothetical protein MU320_28815 [Klebsiella pneumoniae]